MNDVVQPDWLKNQTATGTPGNPAWKPGMKSPNPAGRPKGSLSKSDKIARVLNDEGPEVVRVVLDAAKAGEMIEPLASGAITEADVLADFYDDPASYSRQRADEITIAKNGGGAHLDLMTATYIADRWRKRR